MTPCSPARPGPCCDGCRRRRDLSQHANETRKSIWIDASSLAWDSGCPVKAMDEGAAWLPSQNRKEIA